MSGWSSFIQSKIQVLLLLFLVSKKFVRLMIKDNNLRTIFATLPGMGLNLVLAIINGILCISTHSAWYFPLVVYYTFLFIMRFACVIYLKKIYSKKDRSWSLKQQGIRLYRNCGIVLSVLSNALAGTVVMITRGIGEKSSNKTLIYAVGLYTLIKLIISIKNMIKAKRENSVLMMTLRNIGYSDALVSLLFLQTALVTTHGWGLDGLIYIINIITGTVVCMSALILGLRMVWDANNRINTEMRISKLDNIL